MKIITTERLLLRPWAESDADSLYEYAKDPAVGPIAGWPPHTSKENSLEIIGSILSKDGTFAVCLKDDHRAIGSIALMIGSESNIGLSDDEAEVGYWIGMPFWGRGLIPEALQALIEYAFCELRLKTLWCGYFDGNVKSKRVQEKCGFIYHHTRKDVLWKVTGDVRTEHITRLRNEDWKSAAGRSVIGACELPVYETDRLLLKVLNGTYANAVTDYYIRNQKYLEEWEPVKSEDFFTPNKQHELLNEEYDRIKDRQMLRLWIVKKEEPNRIIGSVGFNNIVYGAFLSCYLGYKLDAVETGNGYAFEAISKGIRIMFDEYGLHRIEANIMPKNARSLRLAERLGLSREGVSYKYLKINGVWEDHIHMVLLNGRV